MSECEFVARADVQHILTKLYNGHVWAEAMPALLILQRHDIPVVVLKSLPQVQELHGDRGARLSHDVDLLVPHAQAVAAIQALQTAGWHHMQAAQFDTLVAFVGAQDAVRRQSWHLLHPDVSLRRISVDLHSDSMVPWRDPPLDPAVWARAVTTEFDGVQIRVLSPEDRLIYLCWHFVADGLPWDKLGDIQKILEDGDRLDWPYLARRARVTGMCLTVHLVCDLVRRRYDGRLSPTWRRIVPLRARIRHRILLGLASRQKTQLAQRATIAFRSMVYDDGRVALGAWREVMVPDRPGLTSYGLNTSNPDESHARLLVRLYVDRIFHHRMHDGEP